MGVRRPTSLELIVSGYALGIVGTVWDWWEHLVGPGIQPPHLLIDAGGFVVLATLAFSHRVELRGRSFAALGILLIGVTVIAIGPFALMMLAPTSSLMAGLMQAMMSSGALLAYVPLVVLAGWVAWHWFTRGTMSASRRAAAGGIVVVALASVWDLYWHQTNPMELQTSMAALPPHQAIFAGFVIGLVGASGTLVQSMPSPQASDTRSR